MSPAASMRNGLSRTGAASSAYGKRRASVETSSPPAGSIRQIANTDAAERKLGGVGWTKG